MQYTIFLLLAYSTSAHPFCVQKKPKLPKPSKSRMTAKADSKRLTERKDCERSKYKTICGQGWKACVRFCKGEHKVSNMLSVTRPKKLLKGGLCRRERIHQEIGWPIKDAECKMEMNRSTTMLTEHAKDLLMHKVVDFILIHCNVYYTF
jgi:hypothetical protein